MKLVNCLPVMEWKSINMIKEHRRPILITSPSAQKVFEKNTHPGINFQQTLNIIGSEKKYVEKLLKSVIEGEVIYAIGGGVVIDVGKYLAARLNKEIICIPTIISTDAFLVSCTGLRENGCVKYYPSKIADKVILDWNLLKHSRLSLHLSGCGDVLSIFTGLFDWKYANENYSNAIALMAKSILGSLFEDREEIKKGTRKGLESIVTALAMEVMLCNLYGNSRPEEGGEHFFTYCIENKMKRFLHGEMVSLGVLITALIQNQDISQIKEFMDYTGINYRPRGISKKVIIETLIELPRYVTRHNLPHGIYHDFNYLQIRLKIMNFLKEIGIT